MSGSGMLEPRVKVYLYRVEAVAARLKTYASRLRGLERRALAKAEENDEPLKTLYLREAENARLSREIVEHMAVMLERLISLLQARGVGSPTARLMVDEALEELSRLKMSDRSSGGPAMLLAEAEAALYELRMIGGS